MITRKLGKIVRGKATPFQVLLAAVLGTMIAFVPGPAQGPGLLAALLGLLLCFNANLGLALSVFFPARLAALLLMPVSFQVGRRLLDGPAGGLLGGMINAPLLAWFGLEHYATSGGALLGLVLGLALGLLLVRALNGLRRKLAALEHDSPRYQALVAKPWVKLALFLFVGGRHKRSYGDLLGRTVGNPIRVVGVVVALALAAGIWFLQEQLAAPILTGELRRNLQAANGATVDLARAEIDLAAGRLTIRGLALADPGDLARDLFRARELVADVSTADLLRKRLRIEKLVVSDASSGAPRERPGELVAGGAERGAGDEEPPRADEKSLDDYLAQAEVWKERLRTAREWLERLSKQAEDEAGAGEETAAGESLRERLERRAREMGWANVVADHLVTEVPTLLVSELVVKGLTAAALEGETFELRATNLSTHPHLVAGSPRVRVVSASGRLELVLGLDQTSAEPNANRLRFVWKEIPVDAVAGGLSLGGAPPVSGGTMDVSLKGEWSAGRAGRLDLPLEVELRGSTLSLPGLGSARVEHFALPIGLRGPLDALKVRVDKKALADALKKAGAEELAAKARERAGELLDDAKARLEQELGDELKEGLGKGLKKEGAGLLERLRKKDGR